MFLDIHVHCGRRGGTGDCLADARKLIARLDDLGIERAAVMSMVGPEWRAGDDGSGETAEDVVEICRHFGGRFVPFVALDPRVEAAAGRDPRRMIERWAGQGARGVGEYVPNIAFDDPRNEPVFAAAQDLHLPLLFHVATTLGGGKYGLYDDPGLPRLEGVLQRFPRLTLLGHSQPFWSEISADVTPEIRGGYPDGAVRPGRVVELMRRYPNLLGDLCGHSGYNALARDRDHAAAFVGEFQDRLLFGTDLFPEGGVLPPPLMGLLAAMRDDKQIPPTVYEKITRRNAEKLLGPGR